MYPVAPGPPENVEALALYKFTKVLVVAVLDAVNASTTSNGCPSNRLPAMSGDTPAKTPVGKVVVDRGKAGEGKYGETPEAEGANRAVSVVTATA